MLEEVETNVQEEQVEATEDLSNAAESVSPENESYDDAYDKAFESIDLDNPDMSLFAEETNVMETPEVPVPENESVIEEEVTASQDVNPFAVDEDGYLVRPLLDRGREVKVTPEELFQFGNKGTNYENKNADIKSLGEHINVLKDNPDIAVDDLQSLVDLAGGNKEALKHLISKYDVDVYDVDSSEKEYTPEVSKYKVDEVQDIWSDFQKLNPEGSEKVSSTFNDINDEFKREVYTKDVLPLFMDDVNNGMFKALYGETQKIKSLNPRVSWLDAYSEANRRHVGRSQVTTPPETVRAPVDSVTKVNNAQSNADAIWDEPGAFEEMTKQLSL